MLIVAVRSLQLVGTIMMNKRSPGGVRSGGSGGGVEEAQGGLAASTLAFKGRVDRIWLLGAPDVIVDVRACVCVRQHMLNYVCPLATQGKFNNLF